MDGTADKSALVGSRHCHRRGIAGIYRHCVGSAVDKAVVDDQFSPVMAVTVDGKLRAYGGRLVELGKTGYGFFGKPPAVA